MPCWKHRSQTGLALAAVVAAGAGGYWAGIRGLPVAGLREWLGVEATLAAAEPTATGAVIYYQDPDGKPAYAATPRQTEDGRAFRAVRASEDVSFEDKPPATVATSPAGPRRVLYYRNPMGLPDTSPTPKKDSMGMDYIPVHEGEDDGGSVVRVSLGKLQRTGVRSELAARRVVGRLVRVPGMVQLDERRISVVATRSDAFVNEVASVTTGDRVTKGQVLLRLYSPDIAAIREPIVPAVGRVLLLPPPGIEKTRIIVGARFKITRSADRHVRRCRDVVSGYLSIVHVDDGRLIRVADGAGIGDRGRAVAAGRLTDHVDHRIVARERTGRAKGGGSRRQNHTRDDSSHDSPPAIRTSPVHSRRRRKRSVWAPHPQLTGAAPAKRCRARGGGGK